jgi:hypothetical protein
MMLPSLPRRKFKKRRFQMIDDILEMPLFRQWLRQVTVFVASHHGRENGYCEEVFQYCHPEVVVISDKNIVHDTQEHCYDNHATGVDFWHDGQFTRRYVLTTRCDGHITINKAKGNPYTISIA